MPSNISSNAQCCEQKVLKDLLNEVKAIVTIQQTEQNEFVVKVAIDAVVLIEFYFSWNDADEKHELLKFFICILDHVEYLIISCEDVINSEFANFLNTQPKIVCMMEYIGNLQVPIYISKSKYHLQYVYRIVLSLIDDITVLSIYMESANTYFSRLKEIGYTYSFVVYNEQILDYILSLQLYIYSIEVVGVQFDINKQLQIGDYFEFKFVRCKFNNCLVSKSNQRTNIKMINCTGSCSCI
jgi:hypothetical protein